MSRNAARPRVLVAGIGGASLGTEILKSLQAADRYQVFGADISPHAFGHYTAGFEQTFVIDREHYVESILDICRQAKIEAIVPGADETATILMGATEKLAGQGVRLAGNSQAIVDCFSDKARTFQRLSELGFPMPKTISATCAADLQDMVFPCVVKPARGSGGSAFVFLADGRGEAALYVKYLSDMGRVAVVQEYLPVDEGEFTVGVLSLTDGRIAGSVALRRLLSSKLSLSTRSDKGVISSGYSQGLIDHFPTIRAQAEELASKVGSVGPLNIQGRVRRGELVPFEINPRFSASTYLRTMAGFNEVDIFLQHLLAGQLVGPTTIRSGYYLRSLSEIFVAPDQLKWQVQS